MTDSDLRRDTIRAIEEGESDTDELGTQSILLEASTMALYVSVVLLAALVALRGSSDASEVDLLGLIWGTTLGLALAHFYAFRMSSRLVRGKSFERHDIVSGLAQLGGASAVALLCTIPILVFPAASESGIIRLLLALLLGIAGYASGRTGDASRLRSLGIGGLALVIGLAVALVKNSLVH